MKQIRRNVFETNSSSCHSLTLTDDKVKMSEIDKRELSITLGEGEYGWGIETLYSWEEKADYLGVECVDSIDKKERLEEALKIAYPNISIEYSDRGYIDHQSYGEIWDELESVEDVYKLLFGNSYIEIDNDNH